MAAPSAVVALVRWPNALIAAAGVGVGAWWAGGRLSEWPVLAAMIAALALAAFANAVNDLHDVGIDRIVHPERPLPSGGITEGEARGVIVAAALAALAASAASRPALGMLTVPVLAGMWAYSRWIKRFGLPGNLLVAGIASLPFLYGGWAADDPRAALPLLALAVPLHLAREIAKDLDDAPGDALSRRTIPVAHGPAAARVALMIALLVFCAALVPWIVRWPRFGLFIVPALLLTALGATRTMRGREGGPARFKAAMLLAMASLVALRSL